MRKELQLARFIELSAKAANRPAIYGRQNDGNCDSGRFNGLFQTKGLSHQTNAR